MTELNKSPLLMDCYNLCQAIEACGASPELTNAVVRASDLMHGLEVIVDSLEAMTARAAINGALARRYETALEFYAGEARYDEKDGWLAMDRGLTAREALK